MAKQATKKESQEIGTFNEKTKTVPVKQREEIESIHEEETEETEEETKEEPNFSNDEGLDFEKGEVGEFNFVSLKVEGDQWTGKIISDVESEGAPDWYPKNTEEKTYIGESYPSGGRVIISKFYRLVQYVEKYGMGKGIVYKIIRGKKAGEKSNDFVEFHITFARLK